MALKKVGAIIALDGEKEFRQNVTSCNKSLSALNSELKLVQAQYDGQENTLEALTKKQETLNKILDEQKRKEEEIRKGLDHAEESYRKVGTALDYLNKEQKEHSSRIGELQSEYQKAEARLEAMNKAGNASEQAIQKQEAVIKLLSQELEKEEKALDQVNAALLKGEKNYQTAGNRVKDWQTKLNTAEAQVIKASAAVNRNAAYMEEAKKSTDHCATSIDGFGKEVQKAADFSVKLGTAIQLNIVDTLTDFTKNIATNTVSSLLDMESAQKQFQAATGSTEAEMRQYKTVMDELHSNNYGQDINDIANAMQLVSQYMGEMDPQALEEVTENAIAMRDVFDMDLSETIRGVDALVTTMGLDSEEAFDLMAKGAQNGLNKSGELADNIAEYGPLWSQAGFSAQEMFAILENGLNSGAYNLDKVNDFVKEFTISLADGRIEENLQSFSNDTQQLFLKWQQGKATSKDVFQSVIRDLAEAENKQEALTIASNTWSALGEDNALEIIASLADVNDSYDDVKGTMESIKDIKYDTLESRFERLGKKFMVEVGDPLAEEALPAIEEGLDFVIENLDTLIPTLEGVVVGVGIFKTVSAAVGLFQTTTKGATTAQIAFNAACNANPIILLVSALVGAGAALISYANDAGEASKEVQMLVDQNQKMVDSANEVTESTNDLITSFSDSSAEMDAQAKYAEILADRIQTMAGNTNRSNEETEVMKGYIAELNQLVPDLNLAYDERAQSLNMNNQELEDYLENSRKEIELEATKEYAIELLKRRTELEIEAIKLGQQSNDIQEKSNALKDEEWDYLLEAPTGLTALIAGKSDERKSYQELTEAQEANNTALEENKVAQEDVETELAAVQQYLEEHGISLSEVTAATDENTEATKNNASATSDAASAHQQAAETITGSYMDMQGRVSEVLESQMNLFEEFDGGVEISTQDLLNNMRSQVTGVEEWANNMAVLADRGVNQGILDKLAEMGPQGSGYVQAFASMTDEELKEANELWSESLDMKSGVEESVQGMIEQYTISINGGKTKVADAMKSVGLDVSEGLGEGIRSGIDQGTIAIDEMGNATIAAAKDVYDTHSPSRVFSVIGQNVVAGLEVGIDASTGKAVNTVARMGNQIIAQSRKVLSEANFRTIGQTISQGISSGITAGSSAVYLSASALTLRVQTEISKNLNANRFMSAGRSVSEGLASGILLGQIRAVSATQEVVRAVENTGKSMGIGSLYSEGRMVPQGLANGILSGRAAVINSIASVCNAAISEARRLLGIHSPSKVFEELGSYTAEGFGIGYQNQMVHVNKVIADSMEIPDVPSQERGINMTNTGADLQLLVEYLPYLKVIAEKNVTLYPNRRAFEKDVAAAADSGMTDRKAAQSAARGW